MKTTRTTTALPRRAAKEKLTSTSNATGAFSWIRGVNLGGWLVMERYITPYMFAVTDCHVSGALCWYPGQASAPPNAPICELAERSAGDASKQKCTPVRFPNVFGQIDYPLDEYHLGIAFQDNLTAYESWLDAHFDNFIRYSDLQLVKRAGLTHLRVPLPHFLLQDDLPYLSGNRWKYFIRLCHWARRLDLQVWPDLHTAPGAQNGFDNCGRQLDPVTCKGWSKNPQHVAQTLDVLHHITLSISQEGLQDVVTGFGLLNEPFLDCDVGVYRRFLEDGLRIVRNNLGSKLHVYVSDMFTPESFNDGTWWLDPDMYANTYLDTHYYQLFAEQYRELSPRQHIALACAPLTKGKGLNDCCYQDAPYNKRPSRAVQRISSEWSVAYDTLPVDMLKKVMDGIAENGVAPLMDRKISPARQDFLRNYAQAQMVAYEAATSGMTHGWFYWTIRMEGGAFAEWDMLRGIREGWIPPIANVYTASEEVYGTCYDILFRTNDTMDVVNEFPPSDGAPRFWSIDDDVVVSHGDSLLANYNHHHDGLISENRLRLIIVLAIFTFASVLWKLHMRFNQKARYTPLN